MIPLFDRNAQSDNFGARVLAHCPWSHSRSSSALPTSWVIDRERVADGLRAAFDARAQLHLFDEEFDGDVGVVPGMSADELQRRYLAAAS